MTSGGNNFNYFPEYQLIKFSAILQFKHSEKMKSYFVGLLCCFVGKEINHNVRIRAVTITRNSSINCLTV